MTDVAYERAQLGPVHGWIEAVGSWLVARRETGLERRLVPVEARFFDAYCRGGSEPGEDLVIDFDFLARSEVRCVLREATAGRPLDVARLEAEYRVWARKPDVSKFRRNVAHLARLLGDGRGVEARTPPPDPASGMTVPSGACDHAAVELLGSADNASYRRCRDCGTTIVTYGGRLWALRPAAGHHA